MEKFKDAYPPNDGKEYVMIKVSAVKDDMTLSEHSYATQTDEYIRVEKSKLQGNVRDIEQREYKAGTPDQIKAFKKRLDAVVTDAVDGNGKQLPARVITKTKTNGITHQESIEQVETIHAKNQRPHSPTRPDGSRAHAVVKKTYGWGQEDITSIHAENGKRNNMKQPDGKVEFAQTQHINGKLAGYASMVDDLAENIVLPDGKIIAAEKGYKDGNVTYRNYKEKGQLNNVVENGRFLYAAYSAKNEYGGETVKSYRNGKPQTPVLEDGKKLPYEIKADGNGTTRSATIDIEKNPQITQWDAQGNLSAVRMADDNQNVPGIRSTGAAVSYMMFAENTGSLVEAGQRKLVLDGVNAFEQKLTGQELKDTFMINQEEIRSIGSKAAGYKDVVFSQRRSHVVTGVRTARNG